jgi:hypothetical protein
MAQTVCVLLDDATQSALAVIAGDRSRLLKHILRARIVLHSAERLPVQEVARQAGVSRPAVWRWQQRFAEGGIEGPGTGCRRQATCTANPGRSGGSRLAACAG